MANKEMKNKKDKTSFYKSFKAEIKKVIWPTPKQLLNNTAAVLVIVLITTLLVFALDFVFESMNKYGIDKIKNIVINSTSEENTVDNEISTNEIETNVVTDSNSVE